MHVIDVAFKISEYSEQKEKRYRRMCDFCDEDPERLAGSVFFLAQLTICLMQGTQFNGLVHISLHKL